MKLYSYVLQEALWHLWNKGEGQFQRFSDNIKNVYRYEQQKSENFVTKHQNFR